MEGEMSPDIAQLANLIQSQLNTQGRLLWAQLFLLLLYTCATFFIAYFGWKQIKRYEEERSIQAQNQKKWKTIEACERLDTSVKFDDFNRAITNKSGEGKEGVIDYSYENMKHVEIDIKGLLNCLDSLAIGISENVYLEEIIHDHYEQIIIDAVELFLLCASNGKHESKIVLDKSVASKDDFGCLLKLYDKWKIDSRKHGTLYCDGS